MVKQRVNRLWTKYESTHKTRVTYEIFGTPMASQFVMFSSAKTYCAWALLCGIARLQWQVTLTINYISLTTAQDKSKPQTIRNHSPSHYPRSQAHFLLSCGGRTFLQGYSHTEYLLYPTTSYLIAVEFVSVCILWFEPCY